MHIDFRRQPGQGRLSRGLDIGLHALGVILFLLGVIDLCLGAFSAAAYGIVGGILIGCVPALQLEPDFDDVHAAIPPGPKGAAVLHPDGSRTALELVYIGRDDDGMAMFRATMPVNFSDGDQLVMDELPPNTGIVGFWSSAP